MHLMTEFGEASALVDGQEYLVRPSFRALATMGTPEVLTEIISDVCEAYSTLVDVGKIPRPGLISQCANVLESCSDLPASWLGHSDLGAISGRMTYRQGRIRIEEVIIIAHHCIKWGVQGNPKRKPSPESGRGKRPSLFDPSEFVSIMIDEFHMSRDDAWSATMTEFQRLCEQRQRKAWGDKPPPPNKEEAKASLAHAMAEIKRARELGIKPVVKKGRR